VIDFLLLFFANMVGDSLGGSFHQRLQRASDRRRPVADGVRSSIRALEGRVLNIGTEWSMGTSELSPRHVKFIPKVGIVGNREIDIVDLKALAPVEDQLDLNEFAYFLITTPKGHLHWGVPRIHADAVIAVVLSEAPNSELPLGAHES
jgi:hypothetical protein